MMTCAINYNYVRCTDQLSWK